MNTLFRDCLNSMMYFFLRVCSGYPFQYPDELEQWAYNINKMLGERGWTDTTKEFIEMLEAELDEGCYREDCPNFIETMEEEFGDRGLDRLLQLVKAVFLNATDVSNSNDGE